MLKEKVKKLLGGNSALARAVGLTKGPVSLWPDKLTTRQRHEVIGALVDCGKLKLTAASKQTLQGLNDETV